VSAAQLVEALRDPATTAGLDDAGWTALLSIARGEALAGTLAERVAGRSLPRDVDEALADARQAARQGQVAALWEVEMMRRALAPLAVPVVLLKGSGYVIAGLSSASGRQIGDLDILVPQAALGAVEAALEAAGWEPVKRDDYDDDYYRRWMHELPPLIHRSRDRMIDVHHTILPPTARPTPDAASLIADAVPVGGGLAILSPEDRVIHAVAHLFADGDLAGGLRNLWDIDRLLREAAQTPGFWDRLGERARRHQLVAPVARALRLADRLYGTPVEPALAGRRRLSDRVYRRRLLARDGWGRETRRLTRLAFYVRSHWLRMPPLMLARHLWVKLRR
jgi:hypothetical protein